MFTRTILAAIVFSGAAHAEVCENRRGAIDGSDPHSITENGHDLEVESLLIPLKDGNSYIQYCVRNNSADTWSYVKWIGPKPGVLAELKVARDEVKTKDGKKFVGEHITDDREFKYGKTKRYPYSKDDVPTLIRAMNSEGGSEEIVLAQAQLTLDNLGYSLVDAMRDQSLLPDYFTAYAASENGGQSLITSTFFTVPVPTNPSELESLLSGGETTYQGDLVAVTVSARSVLNIAEGFANSFELDIRFSQNTAEVLNGLGSGLQLSAGISRAPFSGLDEFNSDFEVKIDLDELTTFTNGLVGALDVNLTDQIDLNSEVGFEDWAVVLFVNGVPYSGTSLQRFANQ